MEKNRKKRKLNFIRVKNRLRVGKIKFYYFEKYHNDLEISEEIITSLIKTAKKSLYKHYKLSLPKLEITQTMLGDDFVKDLKTITVILSLK